MRIEDVPYEVDGKDYVGLLARDEYRSGPRPAVLLSHEGPGLDEHVKGRAVRLASLGFVAFALDYQGAGAPPPLEDAMARLGELMGDADTTRRLGRAGLDILLTQPEVDGSRVAAIGYCFGGSMTLELARDGADLRAAVGFHAGLGTTKPAAVDAVTASVLVCCGAEDPIAPADARDAFQREMADAKVADWRMEVYGGVGHSFTNPRVDELGMPGFAFDATSDRRSWRSMLDLFAETLGPLD